MKFSLRTKLSISYIAVAMICVSLISVFSNFYLEKHFKEYVKNNQDKKSKEIVDMIKGQYQKDDKWNLEVIQNIGVTAMEQGLVVKVNDSSGKSIWNAMVYNNGMCQEMLSHFSQNMYSRYPNWKGGYVEKEYVVQNNGKEVGNIEIGYYGPFYYNDSDLIFLNTLNKVFMSVGVFSLLISLILGAFISERLTTPISRVINTAQMIAKGYYRDRSNEKTSTIEIDQLTNAINDLADTLEKQEKLRKRLTGDVAHELRTPMAVLQSHMEAMIDGVWKPDKERLKSCHDEIMRINRMVGNLEKLARYEGENLVLNKTEVNISELINRIVYNFESEFNNKKVSLIYEGQDEKVLADEDKLSQVIINLVSNALKYTDEGGHVKIVTEGNKDNLIIKVKDNGPGISEDDLPYIFERFYRADKSRNKATGGSGIGLTITKAIVDAHKGTIDVESKMNEGTVVTVILPRE